MRRMNPGFSARASDSSNPDCTWRPAARKRANPCPDTRGSGSTMAATTRETSAAIKASVQGGVRPKWQQGSRLT